GIKRLEIIASGQSRRCILKVHGDLKQVVLACLYGNGGGANVQIDGSPGLYFAAYLQMICAALITFGKFHMRCRHSGAVHRLVLSKRISAAQKETGKDVAKNWLLSTKCACHDQIYGSFS